MSGMTWDEFVRKQAPLLMNSALRVVAHPMEAEDVAQEVFLEVFRSGRLDHYANQPALLRTMATRRALDRLRRRKPLQQLAGSEQNRNEHDPSEHAIADELDQRLRTELARLPRREAEVFTLTALEGYSAIEIAQLLGISRGAVAKALCVARQRLSTAFQRPRTEIDQ